MSKIPPFTARAASLTLTGSLAAVVGSTAGDVANATSGAIKLGSLQYARLVCQYARHASSTTGAPVFAVDGSMDSPDTAAASVASWVPIFLLDGASFAAGAIDGYPEAFAALPTATGTTTRGTPLWDVRGYHWMRVRMADVDTTNRGAVTVLTMGGEA